MKTLLLFLLCSVPAIAQDKFTEDGQAGLVITGGNTHTQSFNVLNETKYAWSANSLGLKGSYLRAKTGDALTALNWLIGLRYERAFSEMLSGFIGESVEGDQFAGVLQRYNTDIGVKRFFRKIEKNFIWFAEAGYRYTNEHDTGAASKGYQKARLYSEAEKFWSKDVSTKLWVEYLPNFTVTNQWLLNSEASVVSQLNTVFAFKTAYGVRFNNAPPVATAQKADTTLTSSLIAKF